PVPMEGRRTMRGQVNAAGSWPPVGDVAVFRPPRLNFAGVCIFCGVLGCTAVECARRHEQTWWAPCVECWAGLAGIDGVLCGSGCVRGVVDYWSKSEAEAAARKFWALAAVPEGLRNYVLRFPTVAEGLAAVAQAGVYGSAGVVDRAA